MAVGTWSAWGVADGRVKGAAPWPDRPGGGDDFAAAYAIDKTGWVLSERQAQARQGDQHEIWLLAYRVFRGLSELERRQWYKRVRRQPDIHAIRPFV